VSYDSFAFETDVDFMNRSLLPAIALLSLLPAPARTADPFLIIVDINHEQRTKQLLTAFAEFDCMEMLSDRQLKVLEGKPYYQVRNAEGFAGRTGLVYSLTADGQIAKARFWNVTGIDVFNAFVQSLLDARGPAAVAIGDQFQKRISVMPTEPAPGKRRVTWGELYVAYCDEVIYLSESSEIFAYDNSAKLNSVVNNLQGKDWYLSVTPKSVPERIRGSLLAEIEQHAGVQLQRRDGEPESEYANRRLLISSYFQGIRSLLMDVDEVTAWTSLSEGNGEVEFRLHMRTEADSWLANLLKEMRSDSMVSVAAVPIPFGTVAICFRLPVELRPLCEHIAAGFLPDRGSITEFLRSEIRNGDFELNAALGTTVGDVPILAGAYRTLHAVNLADVANQFAGTLSQDGTLRISLPEPVSELLTEEHQLSIDNSGELIQFALTHVNVTPSLDQGVTADGSPAGTPIVDLDIDFSKIAEAKDTEPFIQFVKDLELTYHRSQVLRNLPVQIRQDLRAKVDEGFSSFAHRIPVGGDWRVKFNVRTDGTDTIVAFTAGREAFQFLLVRKFVTDGTLLKLLGQ
jgi:hypothetical protein